MKIRRGEIQEAVDLAKRMPDFSNPYNLNSPDSPLPKLDHVLIAEDNGTAVGFRAGYRYSADTFAIWLAGVLPAYRQRGIGGALFHKQNEWLKSQGFKFIRTHVRNSNRAMLEILVKHGYQVVDIVRYDDSNRNKIVFIKSLMDEETLIAPGGLVVGLLRAVGRGQDRELQAKLRDLTISWLRFKYRGRVIEESSVDAILKRACEAGHKYCFIVSAGTIISHAWALGFVPTLEDWASKHEFFLAGEVLNQGERDERVSTHGLLVNLERYKTLASGSVATDMSATGDLPVQQLPDEVSSALADITPQSAAQAEALRATYGPAIATIELDSKSMSAGQMKFLTAVQRQVQNSRRGIFVWNFESYDDVNPQDGDTHGPVSTVYSVAAGLKTSWILESHGFNPDTRIVYFDYSEQALAFKKLLHTEWDGENYPEFLRYVFSKLKPGEVFYQLWGGFSPETIGWDAVNETWDRELERWGGAAVIQEHWRRAKDLRVEYVLCNVLEDQLPLLREMDGRPNSVIWWSNVFFTFYSNWCYTIEERKIIYDRFIRGLTERDPGALIYGNDYNNIAINAVPAGEYAGVYFQTEDDYLEPRKVRG